MTNQPFNRNQIVLIVICGIMLVVLFANVPMFDLPPIYAQASVSDVSSSALNSLGSVAATTVAQAMATATPGLQVDEALAILRAQSEQPRLPGQPEVVGVTDRVEATPGLLMPLPTWTPMPPTPTALIDGIQVAVVSDGGVMVGVDDGYIPCRELRDGSAYTLYADWIGQHSYLIDAMRIKCEQAGG